MFRFFRANPDEVDELFVVLFFVLVKVVVLQTKIIAHLVLVFIDAAFQQICVVVFHLRHNSTPFRELSQLSG